MRRNWPSTWWPAWGISSGREDACPHRQELGRSNESGSAGHEVALRRMTATSGALPMNLHVLSGPPPRSVARRPSEWSPTSTSRLRRPMKGLDMTITTTENTRRSTLLARSPSAYIASVMSEGQRFAGAADSGGLDVPIAACPGWNMRDLVRHLGEIHLWAAANVAFPTPRWLHVTDLTDLARYWPELASRWPSDGDLVTWYRATLANLVDVLRSAPAQVEAFTFLPASTPLTMWARRQASEIAVHRFDAEHARGVDSSFEPTFAADMLDELLSGFAPLYQDVRTDVARVLRIVATDKDEQWWLTMSPSGMTTARHGADADLTLAGTAADLYLTMWNRTSGTNLDLGGDAGVLEVWRNSCQVVWSG